MCAACSCSAWIAAEEESACALKGLAAPLEAEPLLTAEGAMVVVRRNGLCWVKKERRRAERC